MSYLLIMPRFIDKIGEWYHFPLGIPYVSSSMKQHGLTVHTLNLNDTEGEVADIICKAMEKWRPTAVLTAGLSFQYVAIKDIVRAVKKVSAQVPTIVGGGIITSAPEAGMTALEYADYGVIGEGEITVCELCDCLAGGDDCSLIKGIIYRKSDEKWHRTLPRPEIANLDDIPFPDYEGFGFGKIAQQVASLQGINSERAITMSSSRSCPFQCTFCFHTSGSHYRKRSLDNFFAELDILVERYGIKYIFISDELFAYKIDRVREFCERIKPYGIKWWAQFRVCDVTEEMLKLLKDANCVTMGFGLESADDGILKSMHKGIKFEQTERALALTYKYGICIQGGFIFGDVAETRETAKKTLDWWKEHPEYGITLNFITAYPGTPLYKEAVKNGLIKDEVQFIKDGCPIVNMTKMSESDMAWLSEQIMTLPQTVLVPPVELERLELDETGRHTSLTGHCASCGTVNEWNGIRLFTRNVLVCKECGRKHKLPVIQKIVDNVNQATEQILDEYGKVAFWGINDYFSDLLPRLKCAQHEGIYLVDISQNKQGSTVGGKRIQSPSIIDEENIRVVVIPVVQLVATIEVQIRDTYPQVQHSFNITDLINENFTLVCG